MFKNEDFKSLLKNSKVWFESEMLNVHIQVNSLTSPLLSPAAPEQASAMVAGVILSTISIFLQHIFFYWARWMMICHLPWTLPFPVLDIWKWSPIPLCILSCFKQSNKRAHYINVKMLHCSHQTSVVCNLTSSGRMLVGCNPDKQSSIKCFSLKFGFISNLLILYETSWRPKCLRH